MCYVCFYFYSVFIVLISVLLNIRNRMSNFALISGFRTCLTRTPVLRSKKLESKFSYPVLENSSVMFAADVFGSTIINKQ